MKAAMKSAGFDYIIDFGKYKGKTLGDILDTDYSYILWLRNIGILKLDKKLIDAALEEQNEDDHYDWGDWDDIF